MAVDLPKGVIPGQIYLHHRYYQDQDGDWQPKYLLVLAAAPGGDVVFRLLTSRAHSRPENPPCYHGDPYPGFYLVILGGPLSTKSWLDLRRQEDYDGASFLADINSGLLKLVRSVSSTMLCPALECAAAAQDTTRQQENAIRDHRAKLGCP